MVEQGGMEKKMEKFIKVIEDDWRGLNGRTGKNGEENEMEALNNKPKIIS